MGWVLNQLNKQFALATDLQKVYAAGVKYGGKPLLAKHADALKTVGCMIDNARDAVNAVYKNYRAYAEVVNGDPDVKNTGR